MEGKRRDCRLRALFRFILSFTALTLLLLLFLVLLRHYGRTPRVSLHDASLALYLLPSLSFLPPSTTRGYTLYEETCAR